MIKAITMDCSKERPHSHTQTSDKGVENLPFWNFLLYIKTLKIAIFDAENFLAFCLSINR